MATATEDNTIAHIKKDIPLAKMENYAIIFRFVFLVRRAFVSVMRLAPYYYYYKQEEYLWLHKAVLRACY